LDVGIHCFFFFLTAAGEVFPPLHLGEILVTRLFVKPFLLSIAFQTPYATLDSNANACRVIGTDILGSLQCSEFPTPITGGVNIHTLVDFESGTVTSRSNVGGSVRIVQDPPDFTVRNSHLSVLNGVDSLRQGIVNSAYILWKNGGRTCQGLGEILRGCGNCWRHGVQGDSRSVVAYHRSHAFLPLPGLYERWPRSAIESLERMHGPVWTWRGWWRRRRSFFGAHKTNNNQNNNDYQKTRDKFIASAPIFKIHFVFAILQLKK
jgi:hypothetical protein